MERLRKRFTRLDGDQSGAVAMLMMASILILMLMAWVVYDAGFSSESALNTQAAADTAAYSQSAVEARAMNTITFANIGKRMTVGMTSYYLALWAAWIELLAVSVVLTIACWVADIIVFGAITSICEKVTEFMVSVIATVVSEAGDAVKFAKLVNGNYKKDLKSFDDYQTYMSELAPWWSWAEASIRGSRNGAIATASWPPPKTWASSLPGGSSTIDALPVERNSSGSSEMCGKLFSEWDVVLHGLDYVFKNYTGTGAGTWSASDWKDYVAYIVTGFLAMPQVAISCPVLMGIWGDVAKPWKVKSYSSKWDWMKESSNVAFSYQPNSKRMDNSAGGDRRKYKSVAAHSDAVSATMLFDSAGDFAFAKSEISYQDGEPDLWHAAWTARMRPMALDGEWSGAGVKLSEAWIDVVPQIGMTTAIVGVLGGSASFGSSVGDLYRMVSATRSLDNTNIEGLAK